MDPQRQATVDEERLRVLSVLYFVYGGVAALFSLVALVFLVAGTMMGARGALGWESPQEQAGLAFAGCLLVAVGSGLFVLLGMAAVLRILVGFALRRHRYYVLCLVAAGLTSLEIPLGALLGIATLVVLLRPGVEQLFRGFPQPP
jgi:hypothetical protein